jgi:ATP-dependent DNA helicase RecG
MKLAEAIEALRRPLAFAARDDFASLGRIHGLGATTARSAERVAAALASDSREPVARLRAALEQLVAEAAEADAKPEDERRVVVARGLRICARLRDVLGLREPAPTQPARAPRLAPRAPAAAVPAVAAPPEPAGLSAPLTTLKGCGPAFATHFAARRVENVGDLLFLLPTAYEDRRTVTPLEALAEVPDGARVTTRGIVKRASVWPRRFADLVIEDQGVLLTARWFRMNPGINTRFHPGDAVLLSGALRRFKGQLAMAHPDVVAEDEPGVGAGIWVRYPEVEGVPPRIVARLCRAACEGAADLVPDGLPASLRGRLELPGVREALRQLHLVPADIAPEGLEALAGGHTPAHRRLVFDEFFFLQLGLARRRARWRRDQAPTLPPNADPLAEVRPCLGFQPTAAQERAAREIAADLGGAKPMNRLLQGDVGSGKTVVAFGAAVLMARAGCQSALMAPTEILAEQHLRTVSPWAKALGLRVALLTAQTPRGSRESILTLLAAGRIDVLIGTHALLAERVGFDRLGLVVVDEQHRFGVAQRARLRQKGEGAAGLPHLLVMTATPIPRTLALTVYGDLDVTTIDELPPGRKPPATSLHPGKRGRKEALKRLKAEIEAGRQAFVVCPRIEEREDAEEGEAEVADAVRTAAELQKALPGVSVGLLHGRLPAGEREAAMARFRRGEHAVLVSTTVIEVGVDIPAATMMMVLSADRFGVAQLHQLRGRVGRGGGESSCLLLCEPDAGEEAMARLQVLCDTNDGFRIAEADLALRGPGELVGTRQAGMPRLRFGDLQRHGDLLRLARTEAFALVERDPDLAAPELGMTRAVLEERWDPKALYGAESG